MLGRDPRRSCSWRRLDPRDTDQGANSAADGETGGRYDPALLTVSPPTGVHHDAQRSADARTDQRIKQYRMTISPTLVIDALRSASGLGLLHCRYARRLLHDC